MGMTWSDVTVFQWQQLNELYKEYDLDNTKDISIKAVAIITNKTENEILKTPLSDTIKLISKIEFIKGEIPTKRVDYISTKNRRYRCNYNVKDMSAARYIESKHFVTDFTGNLHMIAASMIVPQKLTIFGWKDDKYDARKHEEYANDLLSASIVEVMGSVVFFLSCISHLDKSFSGLFETRDSEDGDVGVSSRDSNSVFMREYGWIYQTKLVADHEKISLAESFELSTINFLNDLAYIKSKMEHDNELIKKQYGKN